ncbi:MAG: winged helix-turn-helix transcriptional regulator [Deltaproteobacteria bacterium]|nr:winged helix-turn-helix transcriptional regulator [Deltaproteobacteria bacterium]
MDRQDLHIFRLMGELDRDGASSQRELSRRLNVSVGLVNAFLKRLVGKGYFKVKTLPRKRLKYFLTPEGLAGKSRLTAEYLRYSISFYREIKQLLLNKFGEMEGKHIRRVLFFGAGEVAELAYLYLQLTPLELVGMIDDEKKGKYFFGYMIKGTESVTDVEWDVILLTRFDKTEEIIRKLAQTGIGLDRIATI